MLSNRFNPTPLHGDVLPGATRVRGTNFKGQRKPTITVKQARAFQSPGRPTINKRLFNAALNHINKVAGGELRAVRRLMARAYVVNVIKPAAAKAGK